VSESDYEKLRNTLHALAGLLPQPRSTEKTKIMHAKFPERFGAARNAGTEI
jgi:hypothetical protein